MSLRLLKKVLQEKEGLPNENRHDDEEEEDHLDGTGSRPSINPFDLLNDGDEDLISEKEERETEIADDESKEEEIHHNIHPKGHKSKKKKTKKSKEAAAAPPSEAKAETTLDELLESLSLNVKSPEQSINPKATITNSLKKASECVMKVDPKYLNVENELRRIFGSKVVKSFEKGNQGRGRGGGGGGGRRGIYNIRKTFLISPSDHWARWDGSFSMEFLETKDGYNYFRYVHSLSYEQGQRAFQAAQSIHDLNGVANVLTHHPYHLDSLTTMADYFRFVGEHQMAADAVSKCLYALECAWHPMFTPFEGNCQLKYNQETNRPLFTSLFTHMRSMDRRGCHRSALEVCKLLLSLDTDDPVGALFCVDYFALRAQEYKWLERFSEVYRSDNSLWMLPNFSYSLAISRFYIEKMEESSSSDGLKSSSLDLMKQALMLHPAVVKKLVGKVPLKDQVWRKILEHFYFRSDQTKIPSLDHLINIYVERSYLIWRLPDVQRLLRSAAELVIELLEHNGDEAKDWVCVRKEAFPSENNEYAHLSVQDFSDSVATLPPENLQEFVADPRMGVDAGMQMRRDQMAEGGGAHVRAPPPREVANRNPLAVLFESMLPWVHYGNDGEVARDPQQQDGHDNDHNHGGFGH